MKLRSPGLGSLLSLNISDFILIFERTSRAHTPAQTRAQLRPHMGMHTQVRAVLYYKEAEQARASGTSEVRISIYLSVARREGKQQCSKMFIFDRLS